MSYSIASSPLSSVLTRLKNVTEARNGFKACCPAHDDHNPSLSIWERDDGSIGLKCYAGCGSEEVLSAMNLTPSDLQPERPKWSARIDGDRRHNLKTPTVSRVLSPDGEKPSLKHPGFTTLDDAVKRISQSARLGNPSHEPWMYHDADGGELGAVVRWPRPEGGKEIRPFHRDESGWHAAAMPAPRPLYNLPSLSARSMVLVTEGEKAADALQTLFQDRPDVVCTTSAGGCQAAHLTDWSPLAGKDVFIFPDNDKPGQHYAEVICDECAKLAPRPIVRVVTLPGLPEKGDAADFIAVREADQSIETIRNEIQVLAQGAPRYELTPEALPEHLDWRPFTLDALPEPLKRFVRVASHALNVDPCYVALPALAVCAAAVGNTVRVRLKSGWEEPCCAWFVLVGESGEGKSPPLKQVLKPLRELERTAFEEFERETEEYQLELARHKKSMQQWERNAEESGPPPETPKEPLCRRYTVNDTTMESLADILSANPRGLLIERDELAGLFNSFDRYNKSQGGDAAKLLELFEGGTMRLDRKTGRKSVHVERALCSLIGGIQPDILKRCLNSEHRESGLAARLLFSSPPRRNRKWSETEITPQEEAPYHNLIRKLCEIPFWGEGINQVEPHVIGLSNEAKAIWIAFHDAIGAERLNETGELAAAFAKLDRHAARLALIIHLIRWAGGEAGVTFEVIDAGSIQSGITLAQWFGHEARRVYLRMTETDDQRDERQLVEWIRSQARPVTCRDVQRGPRRYRGRPDHVERLLQRLVQQRRGRWISKPTDAIHGGRPAEYFQLNE